VSVERRLLQEARVGRSALVVTVVAAGLSTVLILMQATLIADVIARVTRHASFVEVRGELALLLAVVLARSAASYGMEVAALRGSVKVKSQLRRRLVAAALARGPSWLSERQVGELTTLGTRGVDALDAYFARYVPQLVLAVLVPIMVVARIAWSDWLSAVIIAVTLPLIPLFMVLVGAHTKERTERQWSVLARLGGHFLDVVAGLPTLKVFRRSKAQVETIAAATETYRRRSLASLRVAFLSAFVLELLATLAVALVAVEVGIRLLRGDVPYEAALLVLLLTPEAYLPLRALGTQFHASREGAAAARQVFDVVDRSCAPVAVATTGLDVAAAVRGQSLVLANLTVRYDDRVAPALDDFSLTVQPGEHLMLTGPSGSGKSTVLAVLLRLIEPTGGAVRLGTTSLDDVDRDTWLSHVAWLPQHPHVFAGSIADNIAIARLNASRDDVRSAAELAGADEFVRRLPAGYDTDLPERGLTLSTGERQRIALARVLLRDAPLVLLDEPTAHLDGVSADAMRSGIARLMRGRTVIWVSHDPAAAAQADRVVQLDVGWSPLTSQVAVAL
jgi:ATP-binding cassette subfamily C protein CydD